MIVRVKNLLITLFITTISYNSYGQIITIPDSIEVSDLTKKIPIKGTKIIIDEPKGYVYIDELKRYQKNQNNYFQFIEIPTEGYTQNIQKILTKIEQLEKQGGKLKVKKQFKLGKYDAFFSIAPQGKNEQVLLVFGNDTFAVLVAGFIPSNEIDRKEIADIILTTYYDESISVNMEDNLFYTIDIEDSDFKLSTVNGNIGTYSLGGKIISSDNLYSSNFIIGTLPSSPNLNIKAYNEELLSSYEDNVFEDKRIKIKVNGERQYQEGSDTILETDILGETVKGKVKMHQFIRQTPDGIILFTGFDFSENEAYIEEFKKIATTIRFK